MKSKITKLLYTVLIVIILYFPLISLLKYIDIKHLFSDRQMIISIVSSLMISALISAIIGIISLIISRYYFLKKKNIQKPIVFPLFVAVFIYLIKILTGLNSYILLSIGYILILVPIISYLEFIYLKRFSLNNKVILKDLGKVELLKIMDKSIITYYFVSFIFIYGDNYLNTFLFDNRINTISSYFLTNNNNTLIANSLFLSFIVIMVLLLIVYMIMYETKLRGKYEKNN